MKKRYSIIALALLAVLGTNAAERTAQQKRAIAMSVLGSKTARANVAINELKVMNELTVMGGNGVGFAVISNDDRNEAVLAVANNDFNAENIPDGLQWWLDAVNASLEDGNGYTRETRAVPAGLPETVAPMLTCTWGQGEPFNRLCPMDGNSRSLTGCVATAMAQIMYYHKYPTHGQGTKYDTYNHTQIDFSQQTYDYANMKDSYLDGSYSDAQASAVATLMYHCGLTVDMVYSHISSGSHGILAAQAVATYFGYNKNVACRMRDGHSDSDWSQMIYEELAAGRPILYSGTDASMGGHAFVFTGYDAEGKVYVNWGWEGEADGYYDFNILDPHPYENSYAFTSGQNMLTGFAKADENIPHVSEVVWYSNDPNDQGLRMSTRGSSYIIPNLTGCSVANYNWYDFTGKIHVIAEGNDGVMHSLGNYDFASNFIPMIYRDGNAYSIGLGFFTQGDIACNTRDLANGTYTVYLGVQDSGYDEITPMSFGEGKTSRYTLTKTDDGITLDAQPATGIANAVVDTTADDGMAHVYTASGVEVYSAPASSFNINDVPMNGLLIIKKGGETTKVMKK